MRYHGTDIDGPSFRPEQLNVRGKNLNDLIGKYSYTDAIYHLFTGNEPKPHQKKILDDCLSKFMLSLEPDNPIIQTVRLVAKSKAPLSCAIGAGYMAGNSQLTHLDEERSLEELNLHETIQEGLFYFAITPTLLAYAMGQEQTVKNSIEKQKQENNDYLTNIFNLIRGRIHTSNLAEVKIFNDIMVSFHAGFGFLTPTVMLPRLAISTGVPVQQAMAAGYMAAGPSHVGACEQAMGFFNSIYFETIHNPNDAEPDFEKEARQTLDNLLREKKKIPGFGHPLFKKDPRPSHLRTIVKSLNIRSPYLAIYDTITQRLESEKEIFPNIDGISAAIFLSLGINEKYGTGLFLASRTSDMLAHIAEKKEKPAFGVSSKKARRVIKWLPRKFYQLF